MQEQQHCLLKRVSAIICTLSCCATNSEVGRSAKLKTTDLPEVGDEDPPSYTITDDNGKHCACIFQRLTFKGAAQND